MTAMRAWCTLLLLLVSLAPAAFGQGSVSGSVTDSLTREPLRGARIEARSTESATRAESDSRGHFRLELSPGRYAVRVDFIGYRSVLTDIEVADAPAAIELHMTRLPAMLQTIDVVARDGESLVDVAQAATIHEVAPATRVTLTPSDHLDDDPGILVSRKGLTQATFSTRGPTAVNSASLLVLHDYRVASVPSLRLNVPYLIPTTDEDLDRVEVARGPSAVVYGADADRGVVNFITRSPFNSAGTTVSVGGGDRSVHDVTLRHAGGLGSRAAFKLSGEYFEGDDWPTDDPRDLAPRDEHTERAAGEARLDWQPDRRTTAVFSAGIAQAINNVDLTEVGPVQVRDWRYTFGQVRFRRDRLFLNLFYDQNDAGRTFQLYNGDPIVDDSRAFSAQLQYGSSFRGIELAYGADIQRVVPRTEGTIHGRNENRDNVTVAGMYVNGTSTLRPGLKLETSLRADHHSALGDAALSPRVGIIYQPTAVHAFRLTWNRGTSTPVANDLFLDLERSDNLNGLPFPVRARGFLEAYHFRRDCGGLCMRSPFGNDATAFLPLDATVAWPAVVGIFGSQQPPVDLSMIPPPTAQDVSTVLGVLNRATFAFDPVSPADVRDIAAARRTFNSTIETGYRGTFGGWFSVGLDVYHSRLTNIVTPLSVQTPSAFLERNSLEAYLGNFMSSQQAAAIAAAASAIPLGTVSPVEGDSTELLLIGRQGASAEFWGADLSLSAELGGHLTIRGTYSWADKDLVPSAGGFSDIVFNSPRRKGSLGLHWSHPRAGLTAAVQARAVSSYPVRSGAFNGRVDAYAVVDVSIGYRLPGLEGVTLTIAASNLLDDRHREFVGAPELGRLVLARVRAQF